MAEECSDFSIWLNDQIKRLGYTRAEAAEKLGVDRITLSRWLNEGRKPHKLTMERIKVEFGEPEPDPDPEGILERYYSAPEPLRRIVDSMLAYHDSNPDEMAEEHQHSRKIKDPSLSKIKPRNLDEVARDFPGGLPYFKAFENSQKDGN